MASITTPDHLSTLLESQLNLNDRSPNPIFTSTHYTHSTHLTQTLPPSPSQASPTPDPTDSARAFLSAHNIDISTLYPTQIRLFVSADIHQQRRLVQLWTISPPTGCPNRSLSDRLPDWPSTSLELEEQMAINRQQRARTECQYWSGTAITKTGEVDDVVNHHQPETNRPTVQPVGTDDPMTDAEPYMVAGYDSLIQAAGTPSPSLAVH